MRVTTTYHRGGRSLALLAVTVALLFTSAEPTLALTDLFKLSQSSGTPYSMTGATQVYGRSSAVASGLLNIGFTFRFDGQDYTTFSVNTSGAMSLGKVTQRYYYPYYYPNYVSSGSSYNLGDKYPFFAVYWMYVGYPLSNGGVFYKVVGSAPNRVLVVEWREVYMYGSTASSAYSGGTFQARFYEGSNRIEYFYGTMKNGSSYYASIGMVSSSTRWINIWGNDINEYYTYPSGGYYFYRYPSSYPMTSNRLFVFNPCEDTVAIVGDPSQGGTSAMASGDLLFENTTVQRGSNATFTPFSVSNPSNGCNDLTYSASFSGSAAADYMLIPGSVAKGETVRPQIRFTPQATGERRATMTLSFSNGKKYTWSLSGEGLTRMDWIAELSEGGIEGLPTGGTLLSNIAVERGDSRDLRPFTLDNLNPDGAQTPVTITYVLDDPLDEYSLDVPGGTVTGGPILQNGTISFGQGGSSTPVITFMPHQGGTKYGSGYQEATLTVVADGEQRVFTLNGFSIAPALELSLDGRDVLESDRNFYRHAVTCVGEEPTSLTFTMTNTNRVNAVIDELAIYEVDSRIQQGSPRYPQLLDAFGSLVPSNDYVLSLAPGVAPIADNPQPEFPITIGPGETRTFYLTFVGQRPGKRYARAFMRTNAVNFFAPDLVNFMPGSTPEADVEGLMTMEFYGRGVGSSLSGNAEGGIDNLSLVFDPVKVGESAEAETTVYNTGECDMRINVDQARLSAGDVDEFELLEVFGGATKVGQDYLIAPGATATVKARFTPSRSGSRRATLMMATNDSTLGADIMSARGVYYLNLYGVGKADLRAHDLTLSPAVLDGPGSRGMVRLENTSSEVIEVMGAVLGGVDVTEITVDGSKPWPVLPVQMQPGDVLAFGVALNAAAGSEPGVRTAELTFTYGGGDQVRAKIQGLVGTRSLMATPASLFDGMNVSTGSVIRRATVLSNQGTFPVTISDYRIEGPGAADYEVHIPARRVIDAGGFEIIEVIYAPTAPGSQGATLVIENNGTTGPVMVTLNGTSMGTQQGGGAVGSESIRSTRNGAGRAAGGVLELELGQIAPNPVQGKASLLYTIPVDGTIELGLYDTRGNRVLTIAGGEASAGEHTISVDLGGLASGTYFYRLEQSGHVATRMVMIVN